MINPNSRTEQEIHKVFDFTLLLKGAHAAIEILGGIFLYAMDARHIVGIAEFLTAGEIREDPRDGIANYLLHLAQVFGATDRAFAAFYLLTHGIVNGLIVIALWREEIWAYPISFAALGAFIVYQFYLLAFGFSWWIVGITVLDLAIIALVWHEYGVLKARRAAAQK